MTKQIIATKEAPAAIGPYSQAVMVNGTLYCSGQIAIVPSTGALNTANIEAETHQVMANIGGVLRTAGLDYSHVVKATIFMTDMGQYAPINEVYGSYFSSNPPAREAVQVSRLPKDVHVEISVIAVASE
ncbi:MAG: RidA family protein [Bacteroidetes bacterium]|nr:RidA family protein [Bacteroidota bacterium]